MSNGGAKAEATNRVRALAAFYANVDARQLSPSDLLGEGGYGLSKYHLEAMAKPLTHISEAYGGTQITIAAAARARTLGDLIKLVTDAIPQ